MLGFIICTFSACEDPVIDKVAETKCIQYKYNIVGIAGEPSAIPYIEIQYTKDNGSGHNVIESKRISPPFVFGGHKVNICYDSIVCCTSRKGRLISYRWQLLHDYGLGGAEYLRIINHSEDKPIEFFIAGAEDMKVYKDDCHRGLDAIEIMPSIYYKNAPIYYLLFPDEKYPENVAKHPQACDDILYFEGNRCGAFTLTEAWSANDIAKLYRAEFNHSKDTVLYISPRYDSYGRLSKALKTKDPYIAGKAFYGVIRPKEELKGNDKIWLLATPGLCDDIIKREDF